MLSNTIAPLDLDRKTIISNSSSMMAFTPPNKPALTGNKLNISPIVSSSSSTSISSISSSSSSISSKKRPRTSLATANILKNIHPSDYARAAFKANGFGDFESIVKDSEARFVPPTAAMLAAYGTEILMAVRNNNLERAKELYAEGAFQHGCNACNRFGESILHIACRRGHLGMVKFLIDEVGLSCTTIRDDYHRTPLHDAFWTSKASPETVEYLMKQPHVIGLLLCKDKRGFTPLDYSRGEDRGRWLRFLWERRADLRPMKESLTTTTDNNVISLADYAKEEACKDSYDTATKRQRILG